MTRLRVLFAGPSVTWQDAGRPRLLRFGVPASGPMDRGAFALARAAAGAAGPLIEVSRGGLALVAEEGDVTLAVAGGGFVVDHDGRRGGSWQVLRLEAGQVLRLRPGFWGSWCYLAFAGQVDVPVWLGSQATHGPSGLGGGALARGQEILIESWPALPARALPCPVWARPRASVRAVAGPQDRFFDPATLQRFFAEPFVVTPHFDRMGLRLSGADLTPKEAMSIPSESLWRGSVQVNGAGVASVLLADHQTTGGYPKIATVLDADLDGLSQLRPGDRLRFQQVDPSTALWVTRRHAKRPGQGRKDAD